MAITNQEARHTARGKLEDPYNESLMAFVGGTGTINERIMKYHRTQLTLPNAGINQLLTRDAINRGLPPSTNVRTVA